MIQNHGNDPDRFDGGGGPMVTRVVSQRDLLDRLDVTHGVDDGDGAGRPLRKAELERLHVELGLSEHPMGTVPGLRRDIREQVLDTGHKSSATRFNRSELRRLHRELREREDSRSPEDPLEARE